MELNMQVLGLPKIMELFGVLVFNIMRVKNSEERDDVI